MNPLSAIWLKQSAIVDSMQFSHYVTSLRESLLAQVGLFPPVTRCRAGVHRPVDCPLSRLARCPTVGPTPKILNWLMRIS